jgi:putative transposase
MPILCTWLRQPIQVAQTVIMLAAQAMHRIRMRLRSRTALAAETLFLKKQLALYQEPNSRWRCDLNVTRFTLVWLSYWFDWQPALTIVQPETFKRWRRQGWRLLGKMAAKPGRPPIPPELQALSRRMARENVTWGQKRIANELLLKLGLRVSPRTVRKSMTSDCVGSPGQPCSSQRWSTFIRNHVKGLLVGGVMAETARHAKAGLAPIIWLIQSGRNRERQRDASPVTPYGKLVVVHLDSARPRCQSESDIV